MAITYKYYPERDLTIFVVRGTQSPADILRAYRDAKESHGLSKHTIWDGREGDIAHLTPSDLEHLDQLLALIQDGDRTRVGGRAALVVSSDQEMELFENYLKYSYRLPQRRKAVRTMADAYLWVNMGDKF